MSTSRLPEVIKSAKSQLLAEWIRQQLASTGMRRDLIKDGELQAQANDFLNHFHTGAESGEYSNIKAAAWVPTLEMLNQLVRQRERMGFSPSETALFIFSLKEPLFAQLRVSLKGEPDQLINEMLNTSGVLDKLGLYTTEVFQSAREEVIRRQQEELLELSTPVVKMWDGIVALPLIGTLDSARTSVVMESLLQRIVETGSDIAIIDITGVPTVDTLVAQHLLKTVAAARLMGADCIISGIRPQIAQTMVHLAIDLSAVTTKATMAEALKVALQRTGHRVVKGEAK
ncbi:MAG: STAS domain-containing protein [Prosthecobacter sp.]